MIERSNDDCTANEQDSTSAPPGAMGHHPTITEIAKEPRLVKQGYVAPRGQYDGSVHRFDPRAPRLQSCLFM